MFSEQHSAISASPNNHGWPYPGNSGGWLNTVFAIKCWVGEKHGRWQEAVAMLRPVVAHPALRRELRTTRYGPTLLVSLRAHDPSPARPDFTVTSLTHRQDPRAPSLNWPRGQIEPRIPRLALDRLLEEVRRFRPDTVIVEGISLQALLPALRPYVRQLIIDMHNIESDLDRQMLASGIRRATGKINTALTSWCEANTLKTADRVWTCTRADRQRLLEKHRVNIPVDIVPNGIPRGTQTPTDMAGVELHENPADTSCLAKPIASWRLWRSTC
jgi:hypothetical protein